MGVLTRDVILKEMKEGKLKIDPFNEDQVGPGSIDLHLGDEVRVFQRRHALFHITDDADYEAITRRMTIGEYLVLTPGETIHGITRERITLPGNLCGWLEGRSRFARVGLMVHVTSGYLQPGIDNRQVLEMINVGTESLAIHAGTRICQLILMRTEGEAVYRGTFAKQVRL